jgi:hypothetical protein
LLEIAQSDRPEPWHRQHALIRDVGSGFDAVGLERGFSGVPDTSYARMGNPASVQMSAKLQPVPVRL